MGYQSDLMFATGGGCIFGLLIIAINVLYFGGNKIVNENTKNQDEMMETNTKEDVHLDTKTIIANIKEDELVKKTKSLASKLGVSEDDIRSGVRKVKQGALSSTADLDPISVIKMLDWLIILVMIVVLLLVLNHSTKGDFLRIVAAFFPREIEALGLKTWIGTYGINVSNGGNQVNQVNEGLKEL